MKKIVISGAHSNVGKSSLAEKLVSMLQNSVHIKIGHGRAKEGVGNLFYPEGTPFDRIAEVSAGRDYLIIESNRVLRETDADLAIFLTGGSPKPTAVEAKEKADIIRGKAVSRSKVDDLAARLGLERETVLEIIRLAGSFAEEEAGKS
ncbi:MAG: hypothetical protein JW746_02540 [Candidatus Krumholzibacteriota bacterium]|nr:hypothetical protein [Candidatus Krumholzibacteriota bacterium]